MNETKTDQIWVRHSLKSTAARKVSVSGKPILLFAAGSGRHLGNRILDLAHEKVTVTMMQEYAGLAQQHASVSGTRLDFSRPEPVAFDGDSQTIITDVVGSRNALHSQERPCVRHQILHQGQTGVADGDSWPGAVVRLHAALLQDFSSLQLFHDFVGNATGSHSVACRQADGEGVGLYVSRGLPETAGVSGRVLPPGVTGQKPGAAGGTLQSAQAVVLGQRGDPVHHLPPVPG